MKKFIRHFLILFFLILNPSYSNADKWSFYTGMYDFSDDGFRSNLFGVQHINENLYRESFLGTLHPVTGVMVNTDYAIYVYSGFQTTYKLGTLNITPSFTPGLYGEGDDSKDLGHVINFKTEIQLSLKISDDSELAFSYNHISNANLGESNPGVNSYMFNIIKKF